MTDVPMGWDEIRALAPTEFEQFDLIAARAATALPSSSTQALQQLVAVLLQVPGARRPVLDQLDEATLAALEFAEQFVIDVSAMTDELRQPMYAAMGHQSVLLVQVLYVTDVFARARIGLANVFGIPYEPRRTAEVRSGEAGDDLWAIIETFMRDVAQRNALDALTTELVRLRGARVHDCRLCQSRLSVRALDAAASANTPSVFDALDLDDEVLTSRERVAVQLADALVTQPALIDPSFARSVRETFTDTEIVEIVLDVVRNAANKIAVAFGADAPVVETGIEYFDVDPMGNVVANVDPNVVRSSAS